VPSPHPQPVGNDIKTQEEGNMHYLFGGSILRYRFRRARWLAAAPLVGAAVMLGSASAAVAATGWTVETIPQTGNSTVLLRASARTSTDAWAVGQQSAGAGQTPPPPVSYHWNGSVWSLVPTPALGVSSALRGVSASTATDAWAVGFSLLGRRDFGTLMEHWNGIAWSVNSSLVVTGGAAELTGVADLSPTNAWAVGEGGIGGLLEHWNGATWSSVALPDPNFTPGVGQSISASSASDIWVVGSTFNTTTDATVGEALHFNGTAWSIVPMPVGAGAVTDISPGDAWAVGGASIEQWNGSVWSIVPSPTPGADLGLSGIAARGPDDVYAVGDNIPSVNGGTVQGVILRWNGSAWSVDSDPTDGSYSPLFGAAAVSGAANEWAVGTLSNGPLILSHG
jgi:hypothetical protein